MFFWNNFSETGKKRRQNLRETWKKYRKNFAQTKKKLIEILWAVFGWTYEKLYGNFK